LIKYEFPSCPLAHKSRSGWSTISGQGGTLYKIVKRFYNLLLIDFFPIPFVTDFSQTKARPAVVIQNDIANRYSPMIISRVYHNIPLKLAES